MFDDPVNRHGVRVLNGSNGLQPREFDDVVGHIGQSMALLLQGCCKGSNLLRVIGGIVQRFRQERHSADGRFQFVRDVSHKISSDSVQSIHFRAVISDQEHQAKAQWRHPHQEVRGGCLTGVPFEFKLARERNSFLSGLLHQLKNWSIRQVAILHQTQIHRRPRGPKHFVIGIEDDARSANNLEGGVDTVGHRLLQDCFCATLPAQSEHHHACEGDAQRDAYS